MRPSIAVFGLLLTACYSTGEGISPPLDRIYFPVGLATNCDARARDPGDATTDSDGNQAGCPPTRLFVASSDFDLQYNAGSIQALDLAVVRDLVPSCRVNSDCCLNGLEGCSRQCNSPCGEDPDCRAPATDSDFTYLCYEKGDSKRPCGELGQQGIANEALEPGPCKPVALNYQHAKDGSALSGKPILAQSIGIGAFATDILLTSNLDRTQKRLLVPVRGESSLHWIDIGQDQDHPEAGDMLKCSDDPSALECDHKHRVGTDTSQNTRNVKMPPEPYAIAASDEGDAIVVTHQTTGTLSVFRQDPTEVGWSSGPQLEYVHTLSASAAVAVAAVPGSLHVRRARREWLNAWSKQIWAADPFPPGFLVAYSNAPLVDLVRYYSDHESEVARPFVQKAQTQYLQANSGDRVSRGVAFDDTERRQCDELCQLETDIDGCLKNCANQAIGVYVSSRSPASLLVGATAPWALESPSLDLPLFNDVVATPIGPSRIYVGKVLVACDDLTDGGVAADTCRNGARLETRVFLVCFEQRGIVIFDPKRQIVERVIKTGRGPHAMAFDFHLGTTPNDPSWALAYVAHFTDSYVGVVELDRRKIHGYASMVLSLATPVAPRASK